MHPVGYHEARRIAWVLHGDLAQRTGGTIYDREVVDGLRRAGDDVRVVSLPGRLMHELRGFRPDVVVGDELCFRELAIAFRLLVGRRKPRRVLLVHHLTAWETELSPLRRRLVRIVESLAIRASDRVVTTSHATRDRLVAEGTRTSIDVVLPGADRLERCGRLRNADDLAFVFVGSIVPRKRVFELVDAFASASVKGRLVLVGSLARDEHYVRDVRALIAQRGVGTRVVLTGELAETAVARALASADVLVMPSSLEGYGIAATEAIRAGTPVIAARTPGLEEALARCPDATLFVDATGRSALATALGRFATDASLRASMTAAAHAASPHMPTWAACVEGFRAALMG